MTAIAAIILVVASFFTSALTAAAGVGGGLLMLALMTYLVPIHVLIPVHGLVQLGSNISRTWVQRKSVNWTVTRTFLLGSLVGAVIGALVAVQLSKAVLEGALGLFILVMIWVRFPSLSRTSGKLVALGGFATTFVSMFAGATGPLVAVFLKNLFDKHREMVATHGAAMVAQHGVKVLAFGVAGFVFTEWIWLVGAMVVSGFLGVKSGTLLMNRMPERTLAILFQAVLTLAALDLVRRGLGVSLA